MSFIQKLSPRAMLKSGENLRPKIVPLPIGMWHGSPVALLATWFYSGLLRPASGSFGSLAAIIFAGLYVLIPMENMTRFPLAVTIIILVYYLGVWSSAHYAKIENKGDPASVVIDEVVGMWITLLFTPINWVWWGVAFLAFRLFDIWKPFPANWCDRNLIGGTGIMLDDVVAGIYAGLLVWGLSSIM